MLEVASKHWRLAVAMNQDVTDIEAVLRAYCPMQKKWISVRGKFNSCTHCPFFDRIRRTDWGGHVECRYKDGEPLFDFEKDAGIRKKVTDGTDANADGVRTGDRG